LNPKKVVQLVRKKVGGSAREVTVGTYRVHRTREGRWRLTTLVKRGSICRRGLGASLRSISGEGSIVVGDLERGDGEKVGQKCISRRKKEIKSKNQICTLHEKRNLTRGGGGCQSGLQHGGGERKNSNVEKSGWKRRRTRNARIRRVLQRVWGVRPSAHLRNGRFATGKKK